ncbi:MAG: hypothetical protein GY854_23295 [Deltaproteobacteria bacterium]|nr:hypothetical protein [Deltaproteobacteria bacterium]
MNAIRALMSSIQKLTHLIDSLEHSGDSSRLFAAKAAFNFKHSWLEMAQALVEVRNCGRFVEWGYDNFLDYCLRELGLKRAVVDKLTVSFSVLRQNAPSKLESLSEDEPLPSYQALDYYARAMNEPRFDGSQARDAPDHELSPELSGQLYTAVFDEGCTHKQLRERFDPMIRPKPAAKEQHEAAKKAMTTSRRLLEQLQEVEGISIETLRGTEQAVAGLQGEMERLMDSLELILESETGT